MGAIDFVATIVKQRWTDIKTFDTVGGERKTVFWRIKCNNASTWGMEQVAIGIKDAIHFFMC